MSRGPPPNGTLPRPLRAVVVERMVGSERALDAARLVTAFTHGFVSMELSGTFRLGGDIDEAFRYGVDVLIDALSEGHAKGGSGSG